MRLGTQHTKVLSTAALLAVAVFRRAAAPEVRTVAEAGGPTQVQVRSWVAPLAPRATPKPIDTQINRDIAKVLVGSELQQRFTAIGFESLALPPDEIAASIAVASRRYAEIVKRAEISLDGLGSPWTDCAP